MADLSEDPMAVKMHRELSRRVSDAWRDMLSTESGRLIASSLLDQCGVMQPSFSHDDRTSAFREGQRSIGLDILKRIDHYTQRQMLLESAQAVEEMKFAILQDERERDDHA